MPAATTPIGMASRTISLLLGGTVVVLAIAALITELNVRDIAQWLEQMLGVSFLCLYAGLAALALLSWTYVLKRGSQEDVWMETGIHAANGITTLALTYTLLGISLGIGGLAEQTLTPETVQDVIRSLTAKFSLAFLTTVIGLPSAALLRAILMVTYTKNRTNTTRLEDLRETRS